MSDSDIVLTDFQRSAEVAIAKLLQRHGREIDSREVLRGVVPFYSPDPQTVVKLQSADFELWLYDNEASFSSRTGGGAVERLDFKSEPEVITKLLEEIEAALSR